MATNLTAIKPHNPIATEQGKLDATNDVSLRGANEVGARAVTMDLEAAFCVDAHLI